MAKEDNSNAASRIKQLQEEIASLQADAKEQLLQRIRKDIAELNGLGVTYQLVAGRSRGGSGGKRFSDPNRPCPVCKFRTEPFHDARTHRSQGRTKKPFTAEELRKLGLTRA
ncbi:MAG: hypothetical protein U1E49_19685 [Hyphomicrobiaceae bacterium]